MSSFISRGDVDALVQGRLPTGVEIPTEGRDVVALYSEGRLLSSESRLPSCEEIATPYL